LVHRGDIYYVMINEGKRGHVMHKERPVLIISNEYNNCFANTVNVLPITSSATSSKLPSHILIQGFGLSRESYVVCEQITTIDVRDIHQEKYVGTVDDENLLRKIINGVITQIGG